MKDKTKIQVKVKKKHETQNETDPDTLERRCPRLGHPIRFGYCLACPESKAPCFKILDCWWEIFDVQSYLRARLTQEQFQKLLEKEPPQKITSIVELIQKARERNLGR